VPIGKMSYMAPEQAEHSEVDARADVFSLGIVVWEMLTMRTLMPPNDPMTAAQMLKACNFAPPSAYNPKVSAELDAIVMRCLSSDVAARTPSAQAFGMQLREMLHEIAPGYGRDQLARLLGWTFPERGWQMDEPHATARQPSAEERLSMPQVPAAEAMARASMPNASTKPRPHAAAVQTTPDVQPAPLITGAHRVPPPPPIGQTGPRAAVAAAPKRSPMFWVLIAIAVGSFGLAALVVVIALAIFLMS